jgi:hypothetical protein
MNTSSIKTPIQFRIYPDYTPSISLLVKVLLNAVCDLISALEDFLKDVLTANLPESRVNHFLNALSKVLDSVSGANWIDDAEVHNGIDVQGDIVFGQDNLPIQVDHSGAQVHMLDGVRARIDLLQTGNDGSVVLAELLDKPHCGLLHLDERVGDAEKNTG